MRPPLNNHPRVLRTFTGLDQAEFEKLPSIAGTIVVLLIGVVMMSLGESESPTAHPADVAAIRTLYQQMMDGWNQGSGEAFAAVFAEGGAQVAFDGTHFQGRAELWPWQVNPRSQRRATYRITDAHAP